MLAVLGNVTLLVTLFILSQQPFAVDWAASLSAVSAIVAPAYSPALLLFSVILTVLERKSPSAELDPDDHAQGNRMVANAVRLALTFVLSFAVTLVLNDVTMIAPVLFAILLGFIAIVRAEMFAPPQPVSTEAAYRRSAETMRNAQAWVSDSFGSDIPVTTTSRVWHLIALFILAPIVVAGIAMVVGGIAVWGPGVALTPGFVLMCAASAAMPTTLVLVWLAGADKAESPRSRAWVRAFLLTMSAMGIITVTLIFLLSGKNTIWMAAIVAATTVLVSVALWAPRPRGKVGLRQTVELKWTALHLERIQRVFQASQAAWEREQVRPTIIVRALTQILLPFHHALRRVRETR
ncbi:hypothetical protein [Microbacterium sp. LWH10-1.2]|uniref:hypothetical protein n=1 Tax=Microbacterium sp. LWH10-1.2 TaxID=3135255 RepID=UPI0031399730